MTKTIEEAAREYKFDVDGSDWERQAAYDGFVDGANFIYDLPLCERLTEAEKREYRDMYRVLCRKWWEMRRTAQEETHMLGKVVMLERIFGKEFFKEEE